KSTRAEFATGIEAYGTDALRFTFASLATTGKDARFDVKRLEGYRNFCNKLWNAAKFVLANTENHQSIISRSTQSPVDGWINTKAKQLIKDIDYAIETYRFDLYANHVYEFVWHEFCDWFLEFSKTILWDENESQANKDSTKQTMLEVLEAILRLAHPIIPFITEVIWLEIANRLKIGRETVMLESFPSPTDFESNHEAHSEIEWLKNLVTGIRNIRGESKIKPSTKIEILLQNGSSEDKKYIEQSEMLLKRSTNIERINWLEANAEPPAHALCLIGELKLMVPLAGLIDIQGESNRINKELKRNESEVERLDKKLSNQKFIEKAPASVVEKEQHKLTELRAKREILLAQVKDMENLKTESG
ncbi:class I tRNA ligase family protein, partial [Gammaproteobacteria bacterium]|nr:class I tRNA ligase family protein [Gammaproteobacteria bacterium]